MQKTVNIIVDGKPFDVNSGITILEACNNIGIKIPSLCFLKKLGPINSCRVCVVELLPRGELVTACSYIVFEDMNVLTASPKVLQARKTNIALLLSNHHKDCDNCVKNNNCELQSLAEEYDVPDSVFKGEKREYEIDWSSPSFYRNNNKCILCKRCVLVCKNIQTVDALCASQRGFDTCIGAPFGNKIAQTNCINCGQCVLACPTGALSEIDDSSGVKSYLQDKGTVTIVGIAPSARVGLGEEFGLKAGTNVEGKMITALKMLGFNKVLDVNFGADLTVVEEAYEFIDRFKRKENLPMFTSCCPGWVTFVNNFYPEFLKNISTCKSPQAMFGTIAKTYYAQKMNIAPERIKVVTIMPCIAKKAELNLPHINDSGFKDVDLSLSVRELAKLIKEAGLKFASLSETKFDRLLGESSGAGVIFGTSGGVLEAALRTASDLILNTDLKEYEYKKIRGLKGIKEATVDLGGNKVKVAVVSGTGNARALLDRIKAKKAHYDFVEVMACPGGCINGGGMPLKTSHEQNFESADRARSGTLYKIDKARTVRKSHHNPEIVELYKWLGKPNGKKAHELLHTDPRHR